MKKILLVLMLLPVLAFTQGKETVTWADGDTLSASLKLNKNYYLSALMLPQSFATSLTFQVSIGGTTWMFLHYPLADSSQRSDYGAAIYSIVVDSTADRAITLDRDLFYPYRWIKIDTDLATNNISTCTDTTITVLTEKR